MAQESSKAMQSARSISMRYYENELPALHELVEVKFTSLTDNSAYVQLLEYGNIQGLITFSELHRGRITSINQYASVGRVDIMVVIRLDPVNKYIDLSKRTLKSADREAGTAKAVRGREVLNYMCTVADTCQVPLQEMMDTVAWPLYKRFPEGGALDALKMAVAKSDDIFGPLNLKPKVRAELDRLVQMRLKPRVRRYESEVSVTCTTVAGVESIKTVLFAGAAAASGSGGGGDNSAAATEKVVITVKATPQFLLRTQSFDREAALRALHTAIKAMKDAAEALSVNVEVDKEPCDVGGEQGAAAAARSN